MSMPVYLLTDFSCCEDFEKYLKAQNHANRALLDSITAQVVGEWNKKACHLAIMGSNICLIDKDGVTLATVPALLQDGDTITRDNLTGTIKCVRIVAQGANHSIGVWIGTHEQYKALKDKNHQKTAYFFTDVNLSDVYEDLLEVKNWMSDVMSGKTMVIYANQANKAMVATAAERATHATNADYATSAGTAENAKNAEKATTAEYAINASLAVNAKMATSAISAEKASKDGNGNIISDTYGNFGNSFTNYDGSPLTTGTYQFVLDYDPPFFSAIVYHRKGVEHRGIYLGRYDPNGLTVRDFYIDILEDVATLYFLSEDGTRTDVEWTLEYRRIGN